MDLHSAYNSLTFDFRVVPGRVYCGVWSDSDEDAVFRLMKIRPTFLIACVLSLALRIGAQTPAQDGPLQVKGGHVLGETAEQFFSEGYEKDALAACKNGDFKSLALPNKRALKDYCRSLSEARQEALSGKRSQYTGSGDTSELREDTYTFDVTRLVKMELVFTAPSIESNYRGQSFDKILEGTKQAYGPPSSEAIEHVQDAYGVPYVAHRELWLAPQSVILITEKPGPGGSTTVAALTRAEYDHSAAGGAKPANPLQ